MDIEQILLADDDDALRASLGEILSALGFRVLEAGDGRAALRFARDNDVGFSILDFHMPGMNALEILRALKTEDPTRLLPCILMSAGATPGERSAALQEGAFRFLPKPFGLDRLLECVGDTLRTFHPGPNVERVLARLAGGPARLGRDEAGGLPAPLDLFLPFRRRPPADGGRSCRSARPDASNDPRRDPTKETE